MARLDVKAFAISAGITWGVGMALLGWAAAFGWGTAALEALSSVYIGFAPGVAGSLIGALWGCADGAIGGAVIALVYNALVRRD